MKKVTLAFVILGNLFIASCKGRSGESAALAQSGDSTTNQDLDVMKPMPGVSDLNKADFSKLDAAASSSINSAVAKSLSQSVSFLVRFNTSQSAESIAQIGNNLGISFNVGSDIASSSAPILTARGTLGAILQLSVFPEVQSIELSKTLRPSSGPQ